MSDWIRPYLIDWLKQMRSDSNKYRKLTDEFNTEFENPISIMEGLESIVYKLDEIISELKEDVE